MAMVDSTCIEKLVRADWRGRWGKPLTAHELLAIGRTAFEPLFHEPPLGPIPEYLAPYSMVQACVAEYEERLEELDRWMALQLSGWLRDRIGSTWRIAAKVYELKAKTADVSGSQMFWFVVREDHTEGRMPIGEEST